MTPLAHALANETLKLTTINPELPADNQTVNVGEVLMICNHLGKLIHTWAEMKDRGTINGFFGVPVNQRDGSVTVLNMMWNAITEGYQDAE